MSRLLPAAAASIRSSPNSWSSSTRMPRLAGRPASPSASMTASTPHTSGSSPAVGFSKSSKSSNPYSARGNTWDVALLTRAHPRGRGDQLVARTPFQPGPSPRRRGRPERGAGTSATSSPTAGVSRRRSAAVAAGTAASARAASGSIARGPRRACRWRPPRPRPLPRSTCSGSPRQPARTPHRPLPPHAALLAARPCSAPCPTQRSRRPAGCPAPRQRACAQCGRGPSQAITAAALKVPDWLILLQQVREPAPARVAALRTAKENTVAGLANGVAAMPGAERCPGGYPIQTMFRTVKRFRGRFTQ